MQLLPPARCPRCAQRRMVAIAYSSSPKVERAVARGELAFGGWVMWEGAPTMRCLACAHECGALRVAA